MFKRISTVLIVIILAIGLCVGGAVAGITYYSFVSRTIYVESVEHLSEVYHKTRQSFQSRFNRNWETLHTWASYIEDVNDRDKVYEFVTDAKDEIKCTEFYFLSSNGFFRTVDGETGFLPIDKIADVVIGGRDVATKTMSGGREIMLFAVPVAVGEYEGFKYCAIAIGFDNEDIVDSLKIEAFDGMASNFVVSVSGRVEIENAHESLPKEYNFFSLLAGSSSLSESEIDAVKNDFKNKKAGDRSVKIDGTEYYMLYEPVDFEDWTLIGLVPASVVNARMTKLQGYTIMMVVSGAVIVLLAFVASVVYATRGMLKRKDKEILYKEELFAKISVNVDDVFVMIDALELKVDYISPNVEKLTGVTAEDIRKDVCELERGAKEGNPLEPERISKDVRALKPGEQCEWDMEFVHEKTKEQVWFHVIVLCSEIMGRKKYIVVMSDRTGDKAVNNALAEAVAAAQSANRAKSAFLSNMSHDIRTPMNAIIGFATLAAADPANAEKTKDYLSKILSSGNHLLTLINDVLDMSRIESGKICLDETEVNLSDVFHEIKSIIEGQVSAKRLNLEMNVMDVSDENVYCDKLRLKQAMLNLLSNAVKFTPSGGTVTVSIVQRLGAPEGTGNYEITVKDTGIGMSPQFVRKIFEPFERERTAEVNQTQGTGLGMSITKSIIDMMGGSIEVHSEKGKGTEFIVRLTLKLGAGRSEKIAQLEGVKALVASDDFSTCDSVMKMLMRMGMRSEWTLSGKEAILRAKQSTEIGDAFRVYVIDGQLPDMSGVTTAKKIRAIDDGKAIIIMTAYDRAEIEDEALSAGVNALCSKPMFTSDLYDSLLRALGQGKEKEATLPQLNAENCNFEGKRALLVDDNALNREIGVEILQSYGFTVETAENGKQAVEKQSQAAAGYYDVILTDVQMPVMDGYEATKAIRAMEDKAKAVVPIIAMTANAFDEDKQAAFESGMNDFVSKPINVTELIKVLKRNLCEQKK